jgi:hypothetical protein
MIDESLDEVKAEIALILERALAVLVDSLNRQYDDEVAELDKESAGLAVEYAGINEEQEKLGAVLPSLHREAERQADALTIAGDHSAAEAKLAEAREVEKIPLSMEQKKKVISDRFDRIPGEKVAIAQRVFERLFPQMQSISRAAEAGFCALLDGVVRLSEAYQRRTGTMQNELQRFNRLSRLTNDEKSAEWQSLSQHWYSARR